MKREFVTKSSQNEQTLAGATWKVLGSAGRGRGSGGKSLHCSVYRKETGEEAT